KIKHGCYVSDPDCIPHDKTECNRDKNFPAEFHQLVITVARIGCADPHADEHERIDFCYEVEYRWKGAMPAAKEKGSSDCADRDHIRIFSHKEHGVLHTGVFGTESRDKLRLGFRQVEGCPVDLSQRADEEDDPGNEHERVAEDIPAEESALIGNNRLQ